MSKKYVMADGSGVFIGIFTNKKVLFECIQTLAKLPTLFIHTPDASPKPLTYGRIAGNFQIRNVMSIYQQVGDEMVRGFRVWEAFENVIFKVESPKLNVERESDGDQF